MSITGTLTKSGAIYTGFVASLGFDEDVTLRENSRKEKGDNRPDYLVVAKSPRGREIECGAAWLKTSDAKNEYLSLSLSVHGQKVNCNAVQIKKSGIDKLTILPFSDRE